MIYNGDINTQYEQLTGFEDFEIKLVDGYAKIRRIKTKHEQKCIYSKPTGYYFVALNNKMYRLHRIIANHFIPHDYKHNVVDHIDRNKLNYHISNLRWTTQQENTKNKSSNRSVKYEYVDDIPDNSVSILRYEDHWFKDYYYANNTFYYYNQHQFRILPKLLTKNGYEYVNAYDINNKKVSIMINKWDRIKGF